jgi:hypothetical protein
MDAWARRFGARSRQPLREAWVEALVNDQWMAAYRLVQGQHNQPVVAEVRIFPRERTKGRPPGRWSAEVLGIDAKVPEGGISADLVRRVHMGAYRQVGRKFSRWLNRPVDRVVGDDNAQDRPQTAPLPTAQTISGEHIPSALAADRTITVYMLGSPSTRIRGRPPLRSDEFYAKLARDYAQQVAHGSPRPTADVARRRRLSPSKVRDMLHEARRRGLLSPTVRGRFGGQLTDRAREILASGD